MQCVSLNPSEFRVIVFYRLVIYIYSKTSILLNEFQGDLNIFGRIKYFGKLKLVISR